MGALPCAYSLLELALGELDETVFDVTGRVCLDKLVVCGPVILAACKIIILIYSG